jgi:hypothetical protein
MKNHRLSVNAFGRILDIERINHKWIAYDKGNEGKRRQAADIVIPSTLEKDDLITYLDDLLHEGASVQFPNIVDLGQ